MTTDERMKLIASMINGNLKCKGLSVTTDLAISKIENKLRPSWYVDKAIAMDHTHCIYIDVRTKDFDTFLAVLEDDTIMSGGNTMIMDFFAAYSAFVLQREESYLYEYDGVTGECDECEEDGIVFWRNIDCFNNFIDGKRK